jgi:hypothetical protein
MFFGDLGRKKKRKVSGMPETWWQSFSGLE